jgi:hypothetical protein
VAGLTHLRDLLLHACTGLTEDDVEQLLSTAVQGPRLTVCIVDLEYSAFFQQRQKQVSRKEVYAARDRVVATRGVQDTPHLYFAAG